MVDDDEEDVGGSWEGCRADDLTEETPTPAEEEKGQEAGAGGGGGGGGGAANDEGEATEISRCDVREIVTVSVTVSLITVAPPDGIHLARPSSHCC